MIDAAIVLFRSGRILYWRSQGTWWFSARSRSLGQPIRSVARRCISKEEAILQGQLWILCWECQRTAAPALVASAGFTYSNLAAEYNCLTRYYSQIVPPVETEVIEIDRTRYRVFTEEAIASPSCNFIWLVPVE